MSSSATASCENIFAVPRYTFLCVVDDRNMQGHPAHHEYANAAGIAVCCTHIASMTSTRHTGLVTS